MQNQASQATSVQAPAKLPAQRRQRGLTMIEILTWVSIFGLVAAMLAPKVKEGYQSMRATSDFNDFNALVTAYTSTLYSRSNNSADAAVADALANKNVPKSYINGTTLSNGFGGDILIAPATINKANDATAFTSRYLSRAACQKYANAFGLNAALLSVNGTALKANVTVQPTTAAINGACAENQAGNTNEVIVTVPWGQ